jgi:uncharacterized protein YbcV (DUF1398 family)
MSTKAIENLTCRQQRAMAGRPKVGGFPYLAETLRSAVVTRNFKDFAGLGLEIVNPCEIA